MSGVLHPVGPEPARTYWIRRGILVAVVLVVALGVVAAVASLTRAAVATAPPPAIAPAPSSPSPSVSTQRPSASPVPTTGSSATPGPTPASATATASSDPASSATRPSPSTPSAKPSPATTTIGTPDCQAADLRVTVMGDRTLTSGQQSEFTLSLTNRGTQTCLASVTDKNFELKIYSGKDRIWSSRDCAKVLADFDKKLAVGADVEWTMTWNGKRSDSAESCKSGDGTPQTGTYWATAQLKGAEPVQLRMIIG